MKRNLHLTLIPALIVGTLSTAAFGYVLLSPARRWFNADTPRQIHVSNTGVASVTGGDPDHGVTACVNAVNSWNGGGVTVTNGSSGNVSYNQGDGISDVIFSDPLHICTGTCLAATLTGYYSTSTTGTCGGLTVDKITDSDVAFNLSYNYTTPAQGSCSNEIYLDSVLAHEVGHVIGLAHSNTSSALKYASVAYCSHKVVTTDDTNGRNALYNCTLNEGGGGGCKGSGETCNSNSECCSNSCRNGRHTCR